MTGASTHWRGGVPRFKGRSVVLRMAAWFQENGECPVPRVSVNSALRRVMEREDGGVGGRSIVRLVDVKQFDCASTPVATHWETAFLSPGD